MLVFKVIPNKLSKQLENQFPQLKSRDCDFDEFDYVARVCIFDHFLDANEAMELIDYVSAEERAERDLKWSALYDALLQSFDVYLVKYRSRKVVFKALRSAEFINVTTSHAGVSWVCQCYHSVFRALVSTILGRYTPDTLSKS